MASQARITAEARADNLHTVLHAGARRLIGAGIQTARLDAEVLLGHALAMTREQLLVATDIPLRPEHVRLYDELLLRRLRREPVAYITGRQEFWSLQFRVTPDVLIPRPETELLVEIALGFLKEISGHAPMRVLDIGTGSGAVAVSLAKELGALEIWATDVCPAALNIARENATRNGVAQRSRFLCGDLFEPIAEKRGKFHLIVANPPYVRGAAIATLEAEVSQWEPRTALDGGADGLDYYRRIALQSHSYLVPGGAVAVEIGADQGLQVARLFDDSGGYTPARVYQDYAGRDRVVVAPTAAKRVN